MKPKHLMIALAAGAALTAVLAMACASWNAERHELLKRIAELEATQAMTPDFVQMRKYAVAGSDGVFIYVVTEDFVYKGEQDAIIHIEQRSNHD